MNERIKSSYVNHFEFIEENLIFFLLVMKSMYSFTLQLKSFVKISNLCSMSKIEHLSKNRKENNFLIILNFSREI